MIYSAYAQSTPNVPAGQAPSAAPPAPPPAPGGGTQAVTQAPTGAPQGAAPPQQPGFMNMLLLFAPMLLVIYFFIIRPQNKKMKEHQALLGQIKSGDEVITSSGIFGRVTGVTDKVLTVEISDGVRVKLLKAQVSSVNPTLK